MDIKQVLIMKIFLIMKIIFVLEVLVSCLNYTSVVKQKVCMDIKHMVLKSHGMKKG
jgi:hypothetical protein